MSDISSVIGDYQEFVRRVLKNVERLGINVENFPIDHICFRVGSAEEYVDYKAKLLPYTVKYVENFHHGRPILKLILREPLLVDGYSIPLIELPSPKKEVTYKTGLEHLEMAVGEKFLEFKYKYRSKSSGEDDSGLYNKPFYFTFSDGTTFKIHKRPLEEVLRLEEAEFIIT
ncbi:MAG TPA: VOC family protein [Patescibacteria group bacterium]|nr:VOC family protein [Patescibacteria group bacterium]